MMFWATVAQLEFSGQPSFNWWALVSGVAGVALLVYAALLFVESRLSSPAEPTRPASLGAPTPPPSLTFFGLPAALISALLGVGSLAITLLLVVLKTRPHLLALGWTTFIALAAVWLFYARVYRYLSRGRMGTLLSLRLAGMLFLLLLLFQPVWSKVLGPETRGRLAIVLDASASMGVNDQANEPNRYRQSVLAVQNILLPRLAPMYDIQLYAYDGKHPGALPDPDELDKIAPNGQTTDLAVAMSLGSSGGASQVILFSDGIHNGSQRLAATLSKYGLPCHTVSVGSSVTEPSTVPDIALTAIDGPPTATLNNQVVLTASIKSTAMSDRTVKVQLMEGPNQLEEQRLVLRSGPVPQTVQVKYTPTRIGRAVVRVQVPVDAGERNEANNFQDFPMLVTDPKLPVLYVEGRVRPEIKYLRRALEQDPNINAIVLVQTQAGRFELGGLKKGDDLQGLPQTLAQWKRFKVVMFGDLDASFLNSQQQKDLQTAVKEGTGLLMIGGQNSFAPGGWDKTTLADILPVSLAKTTPPQIDAPFVPQLTAAGALHPVFRNIAPYFIQPGGQAPAQQMPQLSGCVALAGPKPGANILAIHPSARINGQPAVVLAVQQYAQGRTAAFAADTTWRWSLFLSTMQKDSPYNRFWGQMVRWLAGQEDLTQKTGASVTAMIPRERYEAGEPVLLRAAVTDKQGQATAFAQVWADLKGPDGKTQHVALGPVPDQLGVYEVKYEPQLAGAFSVTFAGKKDSTDLGKDTSSFTVAQAAGENEILAAQPMNLIEISQSTAADHVELAGAAALAERLANRLPQTALATRLTTPLYHTPSFFILFVAALSLEWYLRRKWQLQ